MEGQGQVALNAIDALMKEQAARANKAIVTLEGPDDVGLELGVNIRLKAMQDARSAVLTALLKQHEEEVTGSNDVQTTTPTIYLSVTVPVEVEDDSDEEQINAVLNNAVEIITSAIETDRAEPSITFAP